MNKAQFLKNSMGTIIYINGLPCMIQGSFLNNREHSGYLDTITMEVTPLRFNDTNGEQTNWYTQIEQTVAEVQTTTSDEIKQIIDNTTKKANYGLYLVSELINTTEKAFINIIETLLDICKIDAVKRVHSGILMTNITKSEATILRDKIFIAWGHNCTIGIGVLPMDEIQKLSDKRLLKKKTAIKDATFGLYLTCHNEPQFKEAYKKQFLELLKCCDDMINKNIDSGLIATHQDVALLELKRDNIVKKWDLDYELTFEIKKIQNGNR